MKFSSSRGSQMTKRKKDALAIQWVFIPFHCTFSTYFWQLGQTRRRTFRWCGTPCGVWAGAGSTRPHRGDRHIFYETKFLTKIRHFYETLTIFSLFQCSGQKLFILHMLVLPLIPITALVIKNNFFMLNMWNMVFILNNVQFEHVLWIFWSYC